MFSANNIALSDAEYSTSKLLNIGSIANLPFLRTPFTKSPESQVSGKWYTFFSLAFACFVASKTLLQWLVTCLNLTLDADFIFCWWKQKQWFLCQQHKQLKIMEMSEAWPDIYDDEYILIMFFSSSRSTKFKNILPWNISQMIMKTIPSSTRIIMSYEIK